MARPAEVRESAFGAFESGRTRPRFFSKGLQIIVFFSFLLLQTSPQPQGGGSQRVPPGARARGVGTMMPAARGTSFRQVNFQRGARAYDQSAVPEQVHRAPLARRVSSL